jgi:probable rRNA maturation factor
MQVEVSIQDCFFNISRSTITTDQDFCPISTATWEDWFKQWLNTMQPEISHNDEYELTLRLTDDTEVQSLNEQYRQKNQPTDVLAFAALEVDSPELPVEMQLSEPLYLGDIVISVETAHRQALQQGHSLKTELAWLASHGLLHLLGWDHPDAESLSAMLNQQSTLLRVVNLIEQT